MKGKKQRRGALAMASSSSAIAAASPRDGEEEPAEEHSLTGLLSDDTMLNIMRCLSTRELLSSLAFVCHRWRRLCQSYSVYELVPSPLRRNRKPWGNMGRKQLLPLAASHASTVEKVHLHGLKQFKSKEIIALFKILPRLQDLAIVSCPDFETTDLELTVSQLPTQLISFDIHRDRWVPFPVPDSCQINDKILANLHQRCPRLQKLDLDCSVDITRKGLDGLLQACTSLTSLDLHSPLLGWTDVAQVFKICKSLCHFSLVSPLLIPSSGSSDDGENTDGFPEISRRGRGASKYWERNFNASAVVSLGEDMPKHLTSIRLYSSPYRSVPLELPPMLGLLRFRGNQLQQLHAQGVFNTSWQTISVWCANLKLLDLTHDWRSSIILTGVEEVVLCGLIQLLKKLEHIALPSATDHILTELGRFCPNLKEIRFRDTNLVYDAVTDSGVRAIAEGCPALKVLSLPACSNLTISSARALAFHCRQLEILILNRCIKFNDDAVAALLPRLSSSLVLLDLFDCRITQSTLEVIRQYAKVTSLRVVAVNRSLWQRSQSVIDDIHSCNPRLRIRIDSGIFWDGFYHGRTFD